MADNPTPKSKIAKLRREIEQLDAKVYECTTDRPAYPARFATAQDLKTERPDRRRDCASHVDSLREKLAALQIRKQSEMSIFQQKKNKVTGNIKTARAALTSLQAQLADARKRLEVEQNKVEVQQKMKAAKCKREAQEKEQLAARQELAQRSISEAEARCDGSRETRRMCWEEVWAWTVLHEEYVGEREEVEERLADFQRAFPQKDIPSLIESLRCVHSSQHIEAKKCALQRRLETIESRLSAATRDCLLLSSSRQKFVERLSEFFDPQLEATVSSLEERLHENWGDAAVLERVVLTLSATSGFDIDEQILKAQAEIVERRIAELEKERTLDALGLSERILECQDEGEQRQSAETRRTIDARGTKLKQQAEDLAKKQVNRIAAVSQWRKEALGLLKTKSVPASVPVPDEVVLDEVRTQLRLHPKKAALERLIQEFAEALKSREERIQSDEYSDVSERLKTATTDLAECNDRKTALQIDRISARSEMVRLTITARRQRKQPIDRRHPRFAAASMLVERLTRWDILAEDAISHVKALREVYREVETQAEEEVRKKAALVKDLAQTRSLQRESHAKLDSLFSAVPTEDKVELEAKSVSETQEGVVRTKRQVDALECELARMEGEWAQGADALAREEAQLREELQSLAVAQQQGASRTPRCDFDFTDDSARPAHERKVTELAREESKPSNLRSSSELQGTRSRSLLRTSVQRLPSRSPINSREQEDLLDLLDLDDDLDQLLDTRYEEPPARSLPEGLSPVDRQFFERVMPLIDGTELYKKYSQSTSLKQRAFDPLLVSEVPPEMCGYGLRMIRLTRDLLELEIKQGLKSIVESTISLDQIHAPLIPQSTMSILKTQKKLLKRKPQSKPLVENLNLRYKEMKECGFVNANTQVYEEKCRECCTYPFSIVLKQSGRLEVIARSYYVFKTWVNGLNALLKRREELPDLCSRLRMSRRWS